MPSIVHSTVAHGVDRPGRISKNAWNESHALVGDADTLLGFDSASNATGYGASAGRDMLGLRGTVSIFDHIPANIRADVAAGTNTSDLSTYFQAAFDAVAEGGTLLVPRGVYDINAAVSTSKGFHVLAEGATFRIGANVVPFTFSAGYGEIKALSSNYTPGALAISVSALSAALASGAPFRIVSDAVDPANRDMGSTANQYRTGEWVHAGPGSTTTNIVLLNPLRFSRGISPTSTAGDEAYADAYTTTLNARVVTLTGKTMSWKGGTFSFTDGMQATWKSDLFSVSGYSFPLLEGITVTRGYRSAFNLPGNYRATVRNCKIANLQDNIALGQYGYGISDASYKTLVKGCDFANVRHGYTTTAPTALAATDTAATLLSMGRTVGGQVVNCTASGGVNAPFDTHHDAEDITFTDCLADGAGSYAFGVRGRNIVFNSPRAVNCAKGFNVFTEYSSGNPDDDLFVAAKPEGLTTATINDAVLNVQSHPLTTSWCRKVFVNGMDAKSTNHVLLDNDGSEVVMGGRIRHTVTTYDGACPITEVTNVGIIDVDPQSATLVGIAPVPRVVIDRSCSLEVGASAATDALGNLHAINLAAGTYFENRGRVSLTLSSAFTAFVVGAADSCTADPESLITWSKDGVADNSFSNILGLRGKTLRARAEDKSCWYDNTGINKAREHLVYFDGNVNVTHTGTGAEVQNVFAPAYPLTVQMDEAGHYVRWEINAVKAGAVGAATITLRSGASLNDQVTLLAAELQALIIVELFTRADNSQLWYIRKSSSPSTGVVTAANAYLSKKARTFDLAALAEPLRIGVSAAVGDTITFETVRVYSDVSGYGV